MSNRPVGPNRFQALLVIGRTNGSRSIRIEETSIVSPSASASIAASAMCQPWLVTNSQESCGAQTGTGSPSASIRSAPSAFPKQSVFVGSATAVASQTWNRWVPSSSTSGRSPPSADIIPPRLSGRWRATPPKRASRTSRATPTQSELISLLFDPRTSGWPDQLVRVKTVSVPARPCRVRSWSLITTGSRPSWIMPWNQSSGFFPPNQAPLNHGLRSRIATRPTVTSTGTISDAACRTASSMACATRCW